MTYRFIMSRTFNGDCYRLLRDEANRLEEILGKVTISGWLKHHLRIDLKHIREHIKTLEERNQR